jgi:type I restriction-modification system DNA methylase subunit
MFEQAFRNIDDILRKEAGCTTELDYTEQTSWLLFLKYLDGLEQDRADEAALNGKKYTFLLDKPYRWETWAAPKGKDGQFDHNAALTGDDLRDFVNQKLFPYLHGFKQRATGPNTIEYKIGEIFGEIKNKIQSGYNLREIIDHIDELRFRSQTEKHELSHLYEAKIKNMGNAGRNGGEYYTPRPLIRAVVQIVAPKIGESIYDGALGSAGFLCESFDYLKQANPKRTTAQDRILQERTFYGKEKKSLAYVIAIMNMILHGIEAPNVIHTNTLSGNLADIQEKDRYDAVLANPPFGGKERPEDSLIICTASGSKSHLGKVAYIDNDYGYQRTYVITVNEKKRVLYRFLYFQMLKSLKKFKAQSVGAGTKFLKMGMIQDLEIALPSLNEQRRIVSTMDSVREETERLASLYERKLAALAALKQSLLHQAFTGAL